MQKITVKAPSIAQAINDIAVQALNNQDNVKPETKDALAKGLFTSQQFCESETEGFNLSVDIFNRVKGGEYVGTVEMNLTVERDGVFTATIQVVRPS